MIAFTPHTGWIIPWLLAIGAVLFLTGCWFQRQTPRGIHVAAAWMMATGCVTLVERFTHHEPPGVRMTAIIMTLLWSMKLVVQSTSRLDGGPVLTPLRWGWFLFGWPGMQPAIFAKPLKPNRKLALQFGARGIVRIAVGFTLIVLARPLVSSAELSPWGSVTSTLATVMLLTGVSLVLHFGLFNLFAAGWQTVGINCQPLFRAPLASTSLSEFWSRRWNLAFSEMTAIAVYRPCHRWLGTVGALIAGFAFSGLTHELAITVPIQAHFGGPLGYFVVHGLLVWLERSLDLPRRCGRWYRLWILLCVIAPLPILFPPQFLREIVWPLAGEVILH